MAGKKLFLIDGSAIAYRAYFAFINNPLRNSRGENTSAIFGFLRFLFMILDNEAPDYLAVVFDPPGPTLRHQQFKAYKATREKMPDDMRDQVPRIHQVLDALNVPILEFPGYEADDVIGTLAKRAERQGFDTYLVTGDKDFLQLVGDGVKMYNVKRTGEPAEVLDAEAVRAKIGLPPEKIVDYLGLMGDTSDNIPGVPGIGEKTAVKLVQAYGTLEAVLEHAEEVGRANVRENLKRHRDDALLSKRLVQIHTDLPIEVDLMALRRQPPDRERVIALFRDLEFNSLIERFKTGRETPEVDYEIVQSEPELRALLERLKRAKKMVVDLEASHQDPMRADMVGLALAFRPGKAFYLPVRVAKRDGRREVLLQTDGELFDGIPLRDLLRPVLEDAGVKKCGHNIKYDMLVLARHGIELQGLDFDTMVASYLINPTLRQHNLDALALEHLNYVKKRTSDLIGKGKKQISMADVPVEAVAPYACEDADITLRLQAVFEPILKKHHLEDLFRNVELPLIYVLMDVERTGVALDLAFLKQMSEELGQRLQALETRIYELAGETFNINSTQQLGEILFDKLKLPKKKRTKTGYSTDASVLEELARLHELPRTLLEYRELSKLKSTYVDALPSLVNPETGRVHTSYNQTVAATGRLSSSDPNLQNIPIRTEIGRRIRRAFVPGDAEHVIVDADYSQIELRIMAHLSQDPVLMEAFHNNEDIHAKTASLVFMVPPEELTPDHRRRAKEINFGIMYGMNEYGLAARLDISREEAREFIASYFATYYKVKEFIDRTIAQVEEQGYVTTLLNRRRYLPEIRSKNRSIREFAKRTAVNTPIQGTAAELIKIAMVRIWRRLRQEQRQTRMIMQVHDELVFEAPKAEVEAVRPLIRAEMEQAMHLDVPIKVDIGVGPNWLEAK